VADTVTLTLAHPLSAAQAERVLAKDIKDYKVGDKITVRRDYALSVIQMGYAAGVDPEDRQQVSKALGADPAQVGEPSGAQVAEQPASTSTKSASAKK
jgi:hypothetical protein